MTEAIPFNNPELAAAAKKIGVEAFDAVALRYGTGLPGDTEVPQVAPLAYHNMQHSLDVCDNALRMAQVLDLTPTETALTVMVGAAHDIVHHDAPRGMERESADWLTGRMKAHGFQQLYIKVADLALMGTKMIASPEGFYIDQQANRQEYPSQSAALVAATVACADMGELYSARSPLNNRHIYQERMGVGPSEDPPMDDLEDFQIRTLRLLDEYRYPLIAAEELFGGLRQEVIDHQVAITHDLQWGEITSWSEVLERDKAFAVMYGPKG